MEETLYLRARHPDGRIVDDERVTRRNRKQRTQFYRSQGYRVQVYVEWTEGAPAPGRGSSKVAPGRFQVPPNRSAVGVWVLAVVLAMVPVLALMLWTASMSTH